ncbi:hypothetical protein JCM10213_000436 [Rhodosporidiobolus nylandii]
MSAVLAALPDLPALVEPASTINGKPIRVKPRVNTSAITPNNIGTVKKLHNCLFPVAYSPRFYADILDPTLTPEEYSNLVYYQDLPVGVLVTRLEPLGRQEPKTLADAAGGWTKVDGAEEAGEGKDDEERYKLYVMTLGVLAPYRRQGLASQLIHSLLTTAAASHSQPSLPAASTSASAPTAAPAPAKKGKKPPSPPSASAKGKEVEKKDEKKDEKEEEEEEPKKRIESVYLHVQVGNDEGRRFWERWGFEVKDTVKDYYRKLTPRDAWLLERKIAPSA